MTTKKPRILFTVGSVLRGDDAAGPLLAKRMEESGSSDWEIIDSGQTPEDDLRIVRRMNPSLVVLVDAADMGLEPGAVRRLRSRDVVSSCLITTHALPLTFLLEELKGMTDELVFLGIQPKDTSFFAAMTPAVIHAVDELHTYLLEGILFEKYRFYEPQTEKTTDREARSANVVGR